MEVDGKVAKIRNLKVSLKLFPFSLHRGANIIGGVSGVKRVCKCV